MAVISFFYWTGDFPLDLCNTNHPRTWRVQAVNIVIGKTESRNEPFLHDILALTQRTYPGPRGCFYHSPKAGLTVATLHHCWNVSQWICLANGSVQKHIHVWNIFYFCLYSALQMGYCSPALSAEPSLFSIPNVNGSNLLQWVKLQWKFSGPGVQFWYQQLSSSWAEAPFDLKSEHIVFQELV